MASRIASLARLSRRANAFASKCNSWVDIASVSSTHKLLASTSTVTHRQSFSHVGYGDGGRAGGLSVKAPPEDIPYQVKGLNHIAIAVPDINSAGEHYRSVYGAHVSEPLDQPAHGVRVVFVRLGNISIELMEPLGEESPISAFLKKNPRGGLHHLCLTVDDLDSAIRHVKKENVETIGEHPKLGAHHHPVMFLNPKSNYGVLCELEEVRAQYSAEVEADN